MKVPKARKLKSGTWFIQLRLDGESIPVTGRTETECTNAAKLIKAEYLNGLRVKIPKSAKNTTLLEACESYIERNKASLSPATVRSYKSYCSRRFKDYQNKKLPQIDWQQLINDELGEVSEKYVKNIWAFIRPAAEAAGYPVPHVKLAKVPQNELSFLQPDEILKFCEAAKGRSYEIGLLLELHGLRLSEVKGLTWDHVDLDRDLITVHGAMVRGPAGNVMKKTNKTESSTRAVPIMIPQLHDALAAVPKKLRTGLVVTQGTNTLLDDAKRTCRRAGVTETGNHGLRRSFASLCYDRGINERQLMSWGGWEDFQTMHKIYIKLAAVSELEAQEKVKSFFQKSETAAQNAN